MAENMDGGGNDDASEFVSGSVVFSAPPQSGSRGGERMRSTLPRMAGFSAAALYQMAATAGAAAVSQLKAH